MGSLRVKIKLTVTVRPVTVRSVGHDRWGGGGGDSAYERGGDAHRKF